MLIAGLPVAVWLKTLLTAWLGLTFLAGGRPRLAISKPFALGAEQWWLPRRSSAQGVGQNGSTAINTCAAAMSFRDELVTCLPQLRGFAAMIRSSSTEADDLTQAMLLRALAERRFVPGTNIKAWLFRTARNLFASELRNRRLRISQSINGTPAQDLQAAATQLNTIELRELRTARAAIKPCQREAVILVLMAGCSYDEAASLCGCALGTIKSRLSRGRAALTVALAGIENAPSTADGTDDTPAPSKAEHRLATQGGRI